MPPTFNAAGSYCAAFGQKMQKRWGLGNMEWMSKQPRGIQSRDCRGLEAYQVVQLELGP